MKFQKNLAFTLAETLIVMGIIGVVAALTIPSLTNSTNNKDVVAKVRKAHTNLEDAFGRMVGTYGEMDEWGALDTNTFSKRLIGSMKLTKSCGANETGNCFGDNTILFGSAGSQTMGDAEKNTTLYKVIKADGVSLGFTVDNTTCTAKAADSNVVQDLKEICGVALIDVDGPNKGKNKHGQDLFEFYITKKGIYPVGTVDDTKFKYVDNCIKTGNNTSNQSQACTAWVVYNGNLDYKRATSEGKCESDTNKTLDFTKNVSCD